MRRINVDRMLIVCGLIVNSMLISGCLREVEPKKVSVYYPCEECTDMELYELYGDLPCSESEVDYVNQCESAMSDFSHLSVSENACSDDLFMEWALESGTVSYDEVCEMTVGEVFVESGLLGLRFNNSDSGVVVTEGSR